MRKMGFILLVGLLCSCTSGGGGGGGSSCGGADGALCPDGQFCNFHDQACGAADGGGTCESIPTSCDATLAPVCTCDLLTFDNECFANKAGQGVLSAGECA